MNHKKHTSIFQKTMKYIKWGIVIFVAVWESVDALHSYIYKTGHAKVMSRRKEWFERMTNAYTVLWWVPAGHRPTLWEAQLKLELLQANGPSPDAFTFKTNFPKPSEQGSVQTQPFDDECPAF